MLNLKSITIVLLVAASWMFFMSADHIDAPDVQSTSADITDYYAFQSTENSNNIVFAVNVQGLLSPSATSGAMFDENVLLEVNIDTNADNVEDQVIQLIPRDGKMYAFGPFAPSTPGLTSTVQSTDDPLSVDITAYGENAIVGTKDGSKLFAGPRDDPFFFDLGAYTDVLAGNATGFSDPGNDTFAGTNVLSVVIEIPKSSIGGSGSVNTWVESKRK